MHKNINIDHNVDNKLPMVKKHVCNIDYASVESFISMRTAGGCSGSINRLVQVHVLCCCAVGMNMREIVLCIEYETLQNIVFGLFLKE